MSLNLPRLLGATAVCTLVLVGATWAVHRSIGTSADPVAATPPPGAATLTIASFLFDPTPLSVAPGTVVAVTNQDKAKHTVTSGARDAADGRFDLKLDGSGSGTFTAPTEPGTYPYICTIHPGMKATLEVAPVTARNAFVLRALAALAILVGGAVHLQQWLTIFRDQSIGPTFLINAVASLVVAVALVATDDRVVRWAVVAGLALSIGSLAALLASRTVGLPGFEATGYDVAEIEAIVAEALATVFLGAALVALRRPAPAAEILAGSSQAPLGAG